jgi:hypothetical protein
MFADARRSRDSALKNSAAQSTCLLPMRGVGDGVGADWDPFNTFLYSSAGSISPQVESRVVIGGFAEFLNKFWLGIAGVAMGDGLGGALSCACLSMATSATAPMANPAQAARIPRPFGVFKKGSCSFREETGIALSRGDSVADRVMWASFSSRRSWTSGGSV